MGLDLGANFCVDFYVFGGFGVLPFRIIFYFVTCLPADSVDFVLFHRLRYLCIQSRRPHVCKYSRLGPVQVYGVLHLRYVPILVQSGTLVTQQLDLSHHQDYRPLQHYQQQCQHQPQNYHQPLQHQIHITSVNITPTSSAIDSTPT